MIGWLCVDAFWYGGSVDDGLKLCARLIDRPDARSETSRLRVIRGNFRRMAGREEEGRADIEGGRAMQVELGRTVDTHSFSMMTACVSLLAGRYDDAEEEIMPATKPSRRMGKRAISRRWAESQPLLWPRKIVPTKPTCTSTRPAIGADDDITTQTYWRAASARVLASRGDHDAACDLAKESLALLDRRRVLDMGILYVITAEVHRAAGRPDEARRFVEQSIGCASERASSSGRTGCGGSSQAFEVVRARVDVLQMLDPVDVLTRLRELDPLALRAPLVDVSWPAL